MINYSRLGYEIKRDLSNFSSKISKNLKRPKEKYVQQMVYGILASNSVHLSEICQIAWCQSYIYKQVSSLASKLASCVFAYIWLNGFTLIA